MRTAVLAALLVAGVSGCADGGSDAGAPGSVAGEGPARPGAGGGDLVVDALPLETPVVLDPVPEGLLVTSASDELSSGGGDAYATLYGDPALADTLDGPVLLVGSSSGSAHNGPRSGGPGEREVDLGGETGLLIPDTDRTWVALFGNDHVDFVVGRGIGDDDLVAAARGADFTVAPSALAPDAVPAGLEPLVAGCPADGPGGLGSGMVLQGAATQWTTVSAVRADPRLAALWGFWLTDPTGTLVRGLPGSAGALTGTGGDGARARVWAEDGMVLSAVMFGGGDELLDRVVQNLRPGTAAEFEALGRQISERPPARAEAPCPPGGGFTSGVDGGVRWVFHLQPNPYSSWGELSACYYNLTGHGGGGGSVVPPPPGELAVSGREGIVGGVAPPGTARVTVTTAAGLVVEAQLAAEEGPRPGERVWGAYVPPGPPAPLGPPPPTVTAYDAAGAVLDTHSG